MSNIQIQQYNGSSYTNLVPKESINADTLDGYHANSFQFANSDLTFDQLNVYVYKQGYWKSSQINGTSINNHDNDENGFSVGTFEITDRLIKSSNTTLLMGVYTVKAICSPMMGGKITYEVPSTRIEVLVERRKYSYAATIGQSFQFVEGFSDINNTIKHSIGYLLPKNTSLTLMTRSRHDGDISQYPNSSTGWTCSIDLPELFIQGTPVSQYYLSKDIITEDSFVSDTEYRQRSSTKSLALANYGF